jgi:predicted transcriptional regulator
MKSTYLEKVGSNLRRERSEKNITQQELAEKANLHITSVQRIENGKFDARTTTLGRMIQALQCNPGRIYPTN